MISQQQDHRRDDSDGGLVVSHTLAYLLARGVPGIVAFLAIPLFTNFLPPGVYANYALMVTAISFANSLLFQWIRLAVVRLFPTDPQAMISFRSTIATLWLTIASVLGVAVALALTLPFVRSISGVLILGWAVLVTQSLFDIVAEVLRADLRPWHFMTLQLLRAASLVGISLILLQLGLGWTSPLIAVAIGMTAAIVSAWRNDWSSTRLQVDRRLAGEMLAYGAPVSITVALASLIFLCDRSLVAFMLGRDAAGVYSVAYDFTSQTITLVMIAVSMSAFPIAVRNLETRGVEAARRSMASNASMLLAVGVPTTVGAAVLAPEIARTFFGDGYSQSAEIIPMVALSAFLAGFKAYHFDAALQFARRTMQQVWIVLAAVVASVLLNLLLIPVWGLQGAAFAAVLTFLLVSIVTAWWGRRYFPLPFPVRNASLVVCASAVMGAVLYPFRTQPGTVALIVHVVAGALLYGAVLMALNCFGLRERLMKAVRRRFVRREQSTSPIAVPSHDVAAVAGASVCVYSPYASGGHPRYVSELLGAIADRADNDLDVEWVSSADLEPAFRSERYPVHAILPPLRKRVTFRTTLGWAASRVTHYVRRDLHFLAWLRRRPTLGIVHLQEVSPATAHLLVRQLKKRDIAVFITVHNVTPHNYPRFLPRVLVDRSLRRAYLQSDCLFVHSTGLAAELERLLKRPAAAAATPRISVVSHGIWTVAGKSHLGEDSLVSRLEERRLLCFGGIRHNKGFHLVLEAAARHQLDGFAVTIAGVPLEPKYFEGTILPLVDRARAAGVPVEVNTNYVPDEDLSALFASHSALVLPYTTDFVAQSGAAFMGLAHGLPVVATRAGGLEQLMSNHCIGATAEADTTEELVVAIHRLFSASGPEVRRIVDGLRSATDELSWSGMAATTVAEYRRVLARSSPVGDAALLS